MINLLELTKRQTLVLSAVAVAAGLAVVIGMVGVMAAQGDVSGQAFGTQPYQAATADKQADVAPQIVAPDDAAAPTAAQPTEKAQVTPAPAKTQPAPQEQAQAKPMQPTPATNPVGDTVKDVYDRAKQFTNKVVTPGDGNSYIGTYGQCPFYESAGAKGCWPPSNIVCNSDWSICSLKN